MSDEVLKAVLILPLFLFEIGITICILRTIWKEIEND